MLTEVRKNYIFKIILSAFSAAAAVVYGCGAGTGDPTGYVGDDEPVYRIVISPKTGWRDTYYDVYVPTGKSRRLAVGSYAGFTSRSLLRFEVEDIPKIINLNKITDVNLKLAYYRESGEINDDSYAYGDMNITAHALYADFDDDRATWYKAHRYKNWEDPGGDFGPAVAEALVGAPDYPRDFISMDITDTFFDWVNNPDANHGLLLKAADEGAADGIKEFYTNDERSKEDAPRLVITHINDDGVKEYYDILPEKDSFITYYDSAFAGSRLSGHDGELEFGSFNGYGRRLLVWFDLRPGVCGIPPEASIIRARLRLFYRPAGRDDRVTLAGFRLLDDFSEDDVEGELESLPYHDNKKYIEKEYEKEEPGYVDMHVNELVQEWVTGTAPNNGLLIKADDETEAAVFPTFASADTEHPERVPYLEVLFTSPTPPWFDDGDGAGPATLVSQDFEGTGNCEPR